MMAVYIFVYAVLFQCESTWFIYLMSHMTFC